MVYNNQYLYQWHVNGNISPNEKLTAEQKKPVGYFVFRQGKWLFINQRLNELEDKTENKTIPIGESVELSEGKKILLSKEEGGRLVTVQIVNSETDFNHPQKPPTEITFGTSHIELNKKEYTEDKRVDPNSDATNNLTTYA
jgi:hypothetical protein